jgi:hypothetical protein
VTSQGQVHCPKAVKRIPKYANYAVGVGLRAQAVTVPHSGLHKMIAYFLSDTMNMKLIIIYEYYFELQQRICSACIFNSILIIDSEQSSFINEVVT